MVESFGVSGRALRLLYWVLAKRSVNDHCRGTRADAIRVAVGSLVSVLRLVFGGARKKTPPFLPSVDSPTPMKSMPQRETSINIPTLMADLAAAAAAKPSFAFRFASMSPAKHPHPCPAQTVCLGFRVYRV